MGGKCIVCQSSITITALKFIFAMPILKAFAQNQKHYLFVLSNLNSIIINLNPHQLNHVIFTDDIEIQPFMSPVVISHFRKLENT